MGGGTDIKPITCLKKQLRYTLASHMAYLNDLGLKCSRVVITEVASWKKEIHLQAT